MLYEKNASAIDRISQQSSHSQSYRIEGGSQRLIDALQASIAAPDIHLNTCVQSIHQEDLSIDTLRDGKSHIYSAEKIVLALPPRITQQHIRFDPEHSQSISEAWRAIPTWMSGHSKIVVIYAEPFWREQNLSGEVFSHQGPLSEIYNASPATEEYYALTSFVALTAQQRMQMSHDEPIDACMALLLRLFGEKSHMSWIPGPRTGVRTKTWTQPLT